jgi:hypothetical protein
MNVFKTLKNYERFVFILQTYIIITLVFLIPVILKSDFHLTNIRSNGCFLYQHGFNCPACGGTRSVDCLLHGHFIKAFIYQPMVMYVVVVFILTYIGFWIYLISHGNIKVFELKPEYVFSVLFIMMIYCFIKNFLLYYFYFDIYSLIE